MVYTVVGTIEVAGTKVVVGTLVVVLFKYVVPLITAAAACGLVPLTKVPDEAGRADTPPATLARAMPRYLIIVRQWPMN